MFDASIGITPAYAGKRNLWCRYQYNHRDHPRLCGEKHDRRKCFLWHGGSPPPMRGKGRNPHRSALPAGITPAYAGKRFFLPPLHHLHRDHPRLCGEKVDITSFGASKTGSPPPMRGKVDSFRATIVFLGITPAYAGKSE